MSIEQGTAPIVAVTQPPASTVFRRALRDSGGAGIALFPLGLAFGVLVVHAGLDWWWASIFTALIYAGSLEFLLVGLVAAMVPLGQIALTAALVNSRHIFYALSFPLHKAGGRAARTYSTFALTDEAYALASARPAESFARGQLVNTQLLMHAYWVIGGTVGALLGSAIPLQLPGIDFALTALFLVLGIDAFKVTKDVPTPIIAAACGLTAALLVPEQMLLVGIALFVVATLARRLLAVTRKRSRA